VTKITFCDRTSHDLLNKNMYSRPRYEDWLPFHKQDVADTQKHIE